MIDIRSFVYNQAVQRVAFGPGAIDALPDELGLLGVRRALILCTPNQRPLAERVARLLGDWAVGIFSDAVMHVPVWTVRAAREEAARLGADCAVAVGGGSTIGLGKAIALESGLPVIAVPTTYAGSEMTPIYGITGAGLKKTGRDARVLPRTVVYDPELSRGLPLGITVTSGLNAVAHAAEGLYAADRNPVTTAMAEQGIVAISQALPQLLEQPEDLPARAQALEGAWLCGAVLGNVGMGLHHKLCHTLGGTFGLNHAATHTIVLPHALAYNASSAPKAMSLIARALQATDAARGVYDLVCRCAAPVALRDIGMREVDLDAVCALAMKEQYPNPRPLEEGPLRELLQRAYEGAAPT